MSADIIIEDPFMLPQVAIKNTIAKMYEETEQLIVNDEVTYKKVTSIYRDAREWKKIIEAKRKELTEPWRSEISRINDKAKEITDPLDRVIEIANHKTDCYQKLLEDSKAREEEKIRAAAALFDCEDEVYIAPVEKIIRGDGALAVTKSIKEFKVLDLSKVPLKYLKVDEKAVQQDIKLGINEIPGLEIYETKTTKLRLR